MLDEVYDHLDSRGVARLGSPIREGDCLIGITKVFKDGSGQLKDASVYANIDQIGVVDRILYSIKSQLVADNVVKVRIKQSRLPQKGDKFTSRYAQKSTIGAVVNEEDMPYSIVDGLTPDIIINSAAIPSRMNMNKLMEIIASKHGAFIGERVDGTSYRPFNQKEFEQTLFRHGYNPKGTDKLIDGRTGKLIKNQIFIGPCYYQALKHHTDDKIQMRATGRVAPTTRQLNEGRTEGGGLRIGEMESEAIMSHGAANLAHERMCLASDAYFYSFCNKCGHDVGVTIGKDSTQENLFVTCNVCKNNFNVTKIETNRALIHVKDLLAVLGVSVRFQGN